ncbi:BZ3500_MvSof-1268-A1-R1_Chr3-1g05992 [Microbotryum saponariae]|uniref:BZ3500_MvSof-1268-A1-R1_Chr3-1g05992 protein n=1 Tax=Microbotryum saponariae TaxID=289078 RepID=A0A2X0L4L6_9BASI|nr:BZ3500_MvSof-1268-A1-R1_Chr3-1g05992 [Microbotryum saponariae]SDA05182.1 BZ3501_MvSof-1269-A2-R1_Chr3-1g05662 [Microbotryum saponariae]
MLLCVACSATLDSSTCSVPSDSEKVLPPHHFVECGHAVCGACVAQRRSLASACIMCRTTHDILTGGSSSGSRSARHRRPGTDPTKPTSSSTPPKATADDRAPPSYNERGDNGFTLGELSHGEDATSDRDAAPPPIDDDDSHSPPTYHQVAAPPGFEGGVITNSDGNQTNEKGMHGEQCTLHYLKPNDTLLGLALHYKVDPPTLAKMNKLPISTLSTTPQLLHTLPFLFLPPSVTSSSSSKPILPAAEERRRLIIRRFQMHTRCSDWALAKAYVDQVYQARARELEMIDPDRRPGGDMEETVRGGELEQALEAWKKDEEWERSQVEASKKGKGKGKAEVTIGSRMKSTGQVEAKVKGWSWPR